MRLSSLSSATGHGQRRVCWCEIEEERAGMLTRFLYENAVEPAQISAVLHDLCGSKVG